MEIIGIGLLLLGVVGFAIWALNHAAPIKTVRGDGNAHLTEGLVEKARALQKTLPNQTDEEFFSDVIDRMEFPDRQIPTKAILLQIKSVVRTLHLLGNVADEVSTPNVLDGIEGAKARDYLRIRMTQMTPENVELVKAVVAKSMSAFCHYLPKAAMRNDDQSSLSFEVHLIDMLPDVGSQVASLSWPFWEDGLIDAKVFSYVRHYLWQNSVFMSGKKLEDKNPKLIPPTEYKGSPREIIYGYLRGTYLADLFDGVIPFIIPHLTRFEHQWIVSPPGTGKSTTLSMMILKDLDLVARGEASVIVMESNRDLIKAIEGLKRFAPGGDLAGRLVVIDVEDVDWPIAINLFDIGLSQINNASPRDREALLNSAVSMLDYVLRALLGAELTSRQSTLFNFTIQLLIHIPNATLDTLLDLMQPKGLYKYAEYIDDLDPDTKQFFELKFNAKEFEQTKSQVTDRIFAIKRIRSLARMFSAPRTKLDLFKEMGEGKVILINAAKSLLQEDGVEVFGRFFLASILLAAEKRQLLAKDDRLATFVYIDECQDVLRRDEKITVLLDQARKFRVAMIMAHQRVEQLTPPVVSALMGSTAIKFASQLSDSNASALARNMGTTPDFIANQPQYSYAVSVRGLTKSAMSLKIPFVDLSSLPRMTEREAEVVRDDMRQRYAIDPKIEPPPPEVEDVEAEYVAPDKPTPRPPREKAAPRDVEVEVIRLGPPKPKRLTKGYVPPDDDAPKEW